jgi:hypothetical protein
MTYAVQDVTVRSDNVMLVEHLLLPTSTRMWTGLQQLIASPDLQHFTIETSGNLRLISVGTPQPSSGGMEQRFISKGRLIRAGSMGTVSTNSGRPAYQVNFWLDSKLICIPKREVMRVYGPGENRRPFPPELVDSRQNGANERTPADGIYHLSMYKTPAGVMEVSFHLFDGPATRSAAGPSTLYVAGNLMPAKIHR